MDINKNNFTLEKGFSRVKELKKKIQDQSYLRHAINKMAHEIVKLFLDKSIQSFANLLFSIAIMLPFDILKLFLYLQSLSTSWLY